MFFVYAIKNPQTGKIYIGQTNDLKKRLLRHNGVLQSKATSFTQKNKGNWDYFYTEKLSTRSEARQREKQLKSAKGREFLKNLISEGP